MSLTPTYIFLFLIICKLSSPLFCFSRRAVFHFIREATCVCSVRCGWGFGMFSPAGALVLGQVLAAQITPISSIIYTCHLEKLLSMSSTILPRGSEHRWGILVEMVIFSPKCPLLQTVLFLLSAKVSLLFPAIKLRKKQLTRGMGHWPDTRPWVMTAKKVLAQRFRRKGRITRAEARKVPVISPHTFKLDEHP